MAELNESSDVVLSIIYDINKPLTQEVYSCVYVSDTRGIQLCLMSQTQEVYSCVYVSDTRGIQLCLMSQTQEVYSYV
jgi:hypothetical protein